MDTLEEGELSEEAINLWGIGLVYLVYNDAVYSSAYADDKEDAMYQVKEIKNPKVKCFRDLASNMLFIKKKKLEQYKY